MNSKANGQNDQKITLKGLIDQARTTQRKLSKESGIAEVTLNSWVAGRITPRLDNAVLVASKLGVSLKTLAASMQIDVSEVSSDYSLINLKILAAELGIERIEDLPENYETLKQLKKQIESVTGKQQLLATPASAKCKRLHKTKI